MLLEKIQDLSVYYYVQSLFSATPFVTVVDGFPVEGLEIPSIAVEASDIRAYPFEIGNRTTYRIRVWDIDVFAKNKAQRDDFAYTIMNALDECIPVYDYEQGFPPTAVPQLGCMNTDTLKLVIVRVMPQLVEKLYYRATVSFTAIYNQI